MNGVGAENAERWGAILDTLRIAYSVSGFGTRTLCLG